MSERNCCLSLGLFGDWVSLSGHSRFVYSVTMPLPSTLKSIFTFCVSAAFLLSTVGKNAPSFLPKPEG